MRPFQSQQPSEDKCCFPVEASTLQKVLPLEHEVTEETAFPPSQGQESDEDDGDSSSESGSDLAQLDVAAAIHEQTAEPKAPLALAALLAEGVRTTLGTNEGADAEVEDALQGRAQGGRPSRAKDTRDHGLRDAGRASDYGQGRAFGGSAVVASMASTIRPCKGHEQEEDIDGQLQEVWADVGARTEEMRQRGLANAGRVAKAEDDPRFKCISYKEVRDWAHQTTSDRKVLQPVYDDDDIAAHCGCVGRSRGRSQTHNIDKKFWASKDVLLTLQMTNFDSNEEHHFRMLRTIYMKLTRSKVCPSIGSHWSDLGFQGSDPRSDLNRSCGVLNVYLLFYFFSHYFELLKAAFLLSASSEHAFPLVCISINLTPMVVSALLEGKIGSLCNSGGISCDVLETACMVHSAALHYFAHRWRTQKRTIKDTEMTMREVRSLLYKNPKLLVKELASGEQEHRSKNDPNRWEFTDMDFGGARKASTQGKSSNRPLAADASRRLANYGVAETGRRG